MKKLILSSILLLSSTITTCGLGYPIYFDNWLSELKHNLYPAQNNMMSISKYYQVIDPFIKMAETRLDIPPILEKKVDYRFVKGFLPKIDKNVDKNTNNQKKSFSWEEYREEYIKEKKEDIDLIYEYLNSLLQYSVVYFNKNYAPQTNAKAIENKAELEQRAKDLKAVIEKIKDTWKTDKINVEAEFERTKWIFEQASKEFFSKLPFYKRVVMKALN